MAKVILDGLTRVDIPVWVTDLASFRRWAESDEFPEEGRICFINGEVWADLSMQQIFSHLRIKSVLNFVMEGLTQQSGAGLYLPDGLRLYHAATDLSVIPDGTYISNDALLSGQVRLIPGREGGYTSADGSPDLVIEVVSDSSEDKDTEWLMRAYWEADIREYWLIDARKAPPRFDIYKPGPKGFVAVRRSAGWVKSAVLARSFRLTATANALGHPDFMLAVR